MFGTSKGGEEMTATEIIVAIVVAVLGSGALTTVVSILVTRHYAKKDKQTEEESKFRFVMEALAHNAFYRNCEELMDKDSLTKEELDNHNYLYKAYHCLGLNSTGDRMHEIILEKPIR